MTIHFIDLDDTLFDSGLAYTLVHKQHPERALLEIPRDEFTRMTQPGGAYVHPVEYNGTRLWLDNATLRQLRRVHPHIKPAQVGVTDRFARQEPNPAKIDALVSGFGFLKGRPDKLVFFTSKNKDAFAGHVYQLREAFATRLGVSTVMVYYLNEFDVFSAKNERRIEREERLLLEYLVGKKVRKSRFVDEAQLSCEQAYYYSADRAKVEAVKRLQGIFDAFVEATDTSLYADIHARVHGTELGYSTHLITGNELNPFLNQRAVLQAPRRLRGFKPFAGA